MFSERLLTFDPAMAEFVALREHYLLFLETTGVSLFGLSHGPLTTPNRHRRGSNPRCRFVLQREVPLRHSSCLLLDLCILNWFEFTL